MKIFFIHNTKNQQNIGCKMTSGGLDILYKDHTLEHFRAESVFKIKQVLNSSRVLKPITKSIKLGSSSHFNFVKNHILRNKKNILTGIDSSDIVIINGEGSIHHRNLTGMILLAIASIAKDRKKPVHIVNATFQGLSSSEIGILKRIDKIVVREIFSQHYLLGNGIKSILGADAAWVFIYKKWPELLLNYKKLSKSKKIKKVIFTGGTNLRQVWGESDFKSVLGKVGRVDYLYIDGADRDNVNFLKNKISIHKNISSESVFKNPKNLLKYSFIVSGRHHINIMALFLGLPLFPVMGNTYKVESTIYSIKGETVNGGVILTKREVQSTIKKAQLNFSL